MPTRSVYVVHYNGAGHGDHLSVMVSGQKVGMDEFTKTHAVIHVTSLTPKTPSDVNNLVALMIAEEKPDDDGPYVL
jgi:hypothetical protein